ncbi:hypothetical protein UFOVP100_4 [uncultured Caudovirales phage]|uniref:Uncharacterized protein n=1 Tax=uncultured Caudovirales phage TaxID=2100421 RepID=A0A6J5KZQ9_9CAUD|nr:hypothetical protein UFOVP100_4 [uncultured Caudovirales phage]
MTTSLSQTVFSPWLTPVRLASTSNVSGTYYNGPNNNGVGATLTVAASSLTIDSVVCNVGDRVLLQTQSTTYQQGVYIVESIGSTVVLQRAADQQSLEQFKAGEYVAVGAGSVNAGNFYTLVEPLPQAIGVNAIVFNADPSAGGVSFSGGASTANALAVFSDTAGNIKAATTTTTLGQTLAVTGAISATTTVTGGTGIIATTGNVAATAGNVYAGSDAHAGMVRSYPSTTTEGYLALAAVNNGSGNFNTTISNAAAIGQSQVVSVPDTGATTANFIMSKSAADQHITVSGLQADAGALSSGISTGGFVGLVKAFSTTATSGFIAIQGAVNGSGNFGTTISNATTQAAAQVVTVPYSGASTANFVLDAGNATSVSTLNLKYGATPVAQVDPGSCTISGAAGASNVCTVSVQLKDGSGTNMSRIIPFRIYSSSAADGLTLQSAASTGYAVTAGGLSLANASAVTTQISAMSSATGSCTLTLTDTGKQTSYLVLVLAEGVKISAQLSSGSYGA